MSEKEKLMLVCIQGKERSPEVRDSLVGRGYEAEILEGGVKELEAFLKKFPEIVTFLEKVESSEIPLADKHELIKLSLKKFQELQALSAGSHYRRLLNEVLEGEKQRKILLVAHKDEFAKYPLATKYLQLLGKVFFVSSGTINMKLILQTFDVLIASLEE